MTSRASVEQLARGETLGRYIVIERLGEGATGVVYAAYDPELDRKVALKILRRPDGDTGESRRQARFVREAKAIAKLAHPNVVGIFDVGVDGDRVFLAMEYLAGGTLRDWMATQGRPWRDVVKMFVAVGKGLAAAHAEGLVHRDFKPDNVLLDRTGTPKVADFGLARLSGPSADDSFEEVSPQETPRTDARVTRTGAMTGTPAYMAPEQFRGKATDGRTDQFAFCVALYEALYGRRPFAAETVFDLAEAVIRERIEPAPNTANVPSWIRRSLLRGLRADPAERHPTMGDLLAALEADPVARMRRVSAISLVAVVVVGTFVGLYTRSERRRLEFEGRVAGKLTEGRQALSEAGALNRHLADARTSAFAAFDGGRRQDGETSWAAARIAAAKLDATLKRAQAAFEAALTLDQSNDDVREALGEALFQRALLAELEFREKDVERHVELMQRFDRDGRLTARWRRPGSVAIRTTPPAARLVLERYDRVGDDAIGRLIATPVNGSFSSTGGETPLPPGSYRVTASLPGFVKTQLPFVVHRARPLRLDLQLAATGEVPTGFVYIPAGRFLYGDADEDWRVAFLNAVPIHERSTGAFFIKAHETTFGEWLEFLRDLPPGERRLRTPGSAMVQGGVAVKGSPTVGWSIELKVSGEQPLRARQGNPLVFPGRRERSSQDWFRMPVVGITQPDMQAYVDWLSRTGRVPGARFCSEVEWERAARGADGRSYPSAQGRLERDDANIDETYGRVRGSFGPDEVGAHPRGDSPFGIADLAGNVWEVVRASDETAGFLLRGGSYYQALIVARATNSEPLDVDTRSFILGFRVCAARNDGSGVPAFR